MPDDKQKLLNIMRSLDSDYESGKLSPERYKYFKAKYQDKLNDLDKYEATNRIRSMQGKRTPNSNKRRKSRKRGMDKRNKEKNDLVQKYIVNPKKDDKEFNKKKKSMNSSTSKLIIVLILVIAFTIGIAVGIFTLDFEDMSVVNSDAVVVDTAFPDLSSVQLESETNTTSNTTYYQTSYEDTYESSYDSDYSSGSSSSEEYYESGSSQGSSQGSSSSGGSNSYGGSSN